MFAFLYAKANSKKIRKEMSSPFLIKMLMQAFLLRFKANYLKKEPIYPSFSLWIPTTLADKYLFFSREVPLEPGA